MIKIFLVGHGQKWVWPIWSLDSKIDYILRMNRWNYWFFACWYKFMLIKRWLNNFWVGMIKNGCSQSGDGSLKLIISEEWIDGISWLFVCWYRFTKIKSWLKFFWVDIVKNGCGQPGHGRLNGMNGVEQME